MLLATLISLDQHEQFTEYLAEVATIDLVNDKEIRLVGILFASDAKIIEHSALQFKSAAVIWAISHDEILIGIVLMELHHTDTVFVFLSDN